jgi:hypothetical protein
MGFFSNKQKMKIEEFCCHYYDSQIFHAIVDGEDASQKILDTIFNSIMNEDQSFSKIDRNLFDKEMASLHLELFALAWLNRFKEYEHSISQSIFTYNYLKDSNRLETWEAMGKYNTAIAQTATMKADGQQMTGDTGLQRATIVRVNTRRADLFEKWIKANLKNPSNPTQEQKELLHCVTRVFNRIEADLMRNNEIGNRRITALFLYRIGWNIDKNLNTGALSKLAAQPIAMYEFAQKILKNVDIQT